MIETLELRSPEMSMSDLPHAILVRIFSYFTEEDLSCRLAPVCRSWRLATRDESLWRTLSFVGNRTPVDVMCRMLRSAPALQTLVLVHVPAETTVAAVRQLCRCNCEVVSVTLRHCTQNERIDDAVLRNLLASCKHLRYLDLEGTQFYTSRFVKDLCRMSHLESLNLGSNPWLSVRDLMIVSLNCRTLVELKVTHNRQLLLTDDYAVFVFQNIRRNITSLHFDVLGLREAAYQALLKCSKIESLHLNNAFYLTGDLFRSLAASFPNLRGLALNYASQLTSSDFRHLFNKYEHVMRNLTRLSLVSCWKLDDEALRAICDVSVDLEHLSVRDCKLLRGVDYAIARCPRLRHLDVAHVAQAHTCLVSAVQAQCLQELVVDDDPTLDGVLRRLKTSRPDLKITRSLSAYWIDEVIFI